MIDFGKATATDVPAIVQMLRDDDLGSTREKASMETYLAAFEELNADPNQVLVVGRQGSNVVATLHLTIIPGLGRGATKRAQIECVRVDGDVRGQGVGQRMIEWAIGLATEGGAGMVQLTTDHKRPDALRFYESLGFINTHYGLKLFA